ncbi:Multifunctional non-homologous end joining DNA repair protein LigD (plasmid) [Actinosynnema sp. ALI-1.44]
MGALLVGVHDQAGRLVYAGHVGTGVGWSDRALVALAERLKSLEVARCPFADEVPREYARAARWVEPVLVGQVRFRHWTKAGRLRHPSLRGLRVDVEAADVRRFAS